MIFLMNYWFLFLDIKKIVKWFLREEPPVETLSVWFDQPT